MDELKYRAFLVSSTPSKHRVFAVVGNELEAVATFDERIQARWLAGALNEYMQGWMAARESLYVFHQQNLPGPVRAQIRRIEESLRVPIEGLSARRAQGAFPIIEALEPGRPVHSLMLYSDPAHTDAHHHISPRTAAAIYDVCEGIIELLAQTTDAQIREDEPLRCWAVAPGLHAQNRDIALLYMEVVEKFQSDLCWGGLLPQSLFEEIVLWEILNIAESDIKKIRELGPDVDDDTYCAEVYALGDLAELPEREYDHNYGQLREVLFEEEETADIRRILTALNEPLPTDFDISFLFLSFDEMCVEDDCDECDIHAGDFRAALLREGYEA
ncbi:hypothetical protein [Nocardia goodfellowii]|uniref:Uncharacterized protein n=1 Tax=Nocardia goodfellowii TaxID=882446 RepID=A0ABS4QD28_9NOCA|nr:hypothetical protein [Nocardia goodfellowii]MBP2189588.1 hypothetical protein [Nocardia goodfellowii]